MKAQLRRGKRPLARPELQPASLAGSCSVPKSQISAAIVHRSARRLVGARAELRAGERAGEIVGSEGTAWELTMFIAMNRFRIHEGRESEFEELWAKRESHLDQVPGFQTFQLLRGATGASTSDGITTYLSHSRWDSRDAFEAWTRSEAFRAAHARSGSSDGVIDGHPVFEGFEVVL